MNHKAVSLLLAVLISTPISMSTAYAQKSSKSQQAKKKKTVAELLSQMQKSDRGGKTQMNKGKTQIPKASPVIQGSAPKRNPEIIKPPKSSELFQREGGLKAEYERVLDQQIAELYKLTNKFKNSPNRGEMWLRLAELYVEKASLIDALKQDQYDQRLRAYQAGKTKVKPKLDLAAARSLNKKALQLYEWFARDFPKDPKIPQALFFIGYNNFELGRIAKGVKSYESLVKNHPRSPFVAEAYFALAEYHFENDRWSEAYKKYSPIIKQKNHPLHSFSMYKGAWSLYRLGKFPQALNYIEYIIKSGREQATGELAGRRAVNRNKLESEATRDLVQFYAPVGSAEKAESYFEKMIEGDITPHMERLSQIYTVRGNRDGAAYILKTLIAKNPTSANAFNYQYQIVQIYFYAKNTSKFKEELYRWVHDYNDKSAWHQANANKKEVIENSDKLRETTLRNYTLQEHQTAQNSRTKYSQTQANQAYQMYLTNFPQSPSRGDMTFYYGELLYDMGQYDDAATQYNWVVQNAPKSKFFDKSAQNLIHAVEKGVPSDKELQKRIGTSLEPVALDTKVEKFINAGKWYVQKFPMSEKNPEIEFRIGRLYYQSNHFDEAHEVFKAIVQKYPRTKYAEYSANLMLDIYSLRKDYVGLEKTGGELLANPAIADSKAGADIRGVLEKASFKKAQDLEGSKNYAESATQYEIFAKQNPKSSLATQALFNSAVNFERAGQNPKALANYKQVIAQKGNSHQDLKTKSKRLSAKLLQDSAQFESAAKLFREAAAENPKDPLSSNLIFTSAVLYETVGRNKQALSAYEDYIKTEKKHQERLDAVFSMAQIHRRSGQNLAAIRKYEEYVDGGAADVYKVAEAQFHLFDLYAKRRQNDKSETWRKRVLAMYKRVPRQRQQEIAHFAAEARIKDATNALAELKAIRLPADPAKLKKSMDQKLQILGNIKKIISDVISYNSGDEIVSGLTLLGQAYQNMGDSLVQAPLPKGLTAEEQKIYREKVAKELADPQYALAKDSYQKAVEKAWELEAFPASYKIAFNYMNRLDKKNYYDGDEIPSDSRLVNWMIK